MPSAKVWNRLKGLSFMLPAREINVTYADIVKVYIVNFINIGMVFRLCCL
jgi:hypothetical protein